VKCQKYLFDLMMSQFNCLKPFVVNMKQDYKVGRSYKVVTIIFIKIGIENYNCTVYST